MCEPLYIKIVALLIASDGGEVYILSKFISTVHDLGIPQHLL